MFPLFIDDAHFTPQFNNYLSKEIASRLVLKSKSKKSERDEMSVRTKSLKDDFQDIYPLW